MMRYIKAEEASRLLYQEIADRLRTDVNNGLTSKEAERRRLVYGHNEFDIAEEEPLWKKYLGQVYF